MKELIKKHIGGKKVLLLFILTNSIYAIMLAVTIPKVMSFAGGMKLLDMIPSGYTAEYVTLLFNKLGIEGRNAYLYNQIPFDMVYPVLFGVSYCLVLAYFLNKLGKLNSTIFYLCFIPVFAGLFDYCENIGIISMLSQFPENSMFLAKLTSVFSVLKSTLTTSYFIILIAVLIVFANSKLVRKNSQPINE